MVYLARSDAPAADDEAVPGASEAATALLWSDPPSAALLDVTKSKEAERQSEDVLGQVRLKQRTAFSIQESGILCCVRYRYQSHVVGSEPLQQIACIGAPAQSYQASARGITQSAHIDSNKGHLS